MQETGFETLPLATELRQALRDMGFEKTTPIQALSIPPILEGKDVVAQAQTGTGKTAAFGIPMIQRLGKKSKNVEGLVLCPTRELAVQVAGELARLARYRRDIGVVAVYGGQPIAEQIRDLRWKARIIVGTPGRTIDHMYRGTLKLTDVTTVVLDEADRMLDMGFQEDIEMILHATPPERQTLLFSATMPKAIVELARKYQRDPHSLNVVTGQVTVPEVDQSYFEVKQFRKLDLLCRLMDTYSFTSSLIFCNTKRRVDEVARDLQTLGYRVDSLHGDMTQSRRDRTMRGFRRGSSRILVATDVASRGLDVSAIEVVVNYDLPKEEEYYVHRIGRTARMGKRGHAFSLVTPQEIRKLHDIQTYVKTKIRVASLSSLKAGDTTERLAGSAVA